MHHTTRPSEALRQVASNQSGVFSRVQAMEHGVGRHAISRLLRDRQWHAVTPGIYSLSPTPDWMGLAWGGVLLGGEDGVLGAEAAMPLHGVGAAPRSVVVFSGERRVRNRGPWRFVAGIRTARGSPPRVPMEDATLQVCARAEPDRVMATLAAAISSRRTTSGHIRARAEALTTLPHRQLILEMLTEVTVGVESPLESRYLRDVERAHGLPRGLRQISVSTGTRTEVAYLDLRVLVELDGRLGHIDDGAWRDYARDNKHAVVGFTTLRFGWFDVTQEPCAVASQVARVLARNGWCGTPRRCGSCTSMLF